MKFRKKIKRTSIVLPRHSFKKIAFALPAFSGGGAERVMVMLANKFHDWGFDVDFIVDSDVGPYRVSLRPKITKIVLTNEDDCWIKKRVNALRSFLRYFRSGRPDVLLSTIRKFNVFTLFVKQISRSKTPVVVREADTLDTMWHEGGISNKILLFRMKFFYKRSAAIIANSNVTREDILAHIGCGKILVSTIYNPVDIKEINGLISGVSKSTTLRVVSIGRLVYKKNFSDLIRAFPLVLEKYHDAQLDIYGEGDERDRLLSLITSLCMQDNIKLHGFTVNPFKNFATANVFVQTSLWEGFGCVLTEAMACGTPVVAYDSKGAMREILADGKYGKLVPVGNLSLLAAAIIEQFEKPTPPELLAEAVARFDLDKIASEYLEKLRLARMACSASSQGQL